VQQPIQDLTHGQQMGIGRRPALNLVDVVTRTPGQVGRQEFGVMGLFAAVSNRWKRRTASTSSCSRLISSMFEAICVESMRC